MRGIRFLVATGVLVALLLGGCARVQVYDAVSNSVAAPTVEKVEEEPGLRVLAIEFDPPLSSQTWSMTPPHLSLLVAVENSSRKTEKDVTVRVELWQSLSDREPVLTRTNSLSAVGAGEVRVVTFSGLGDLQPALAYWLKVRTFSSAGHSTADSQRLYRIQWGQEP